MLLLEKNHPFVLMHYICKMLLQTLQKYQISTFSMVLSVQWPLKVEVLLVLIYISETFYVIF